MREKRVSHALQTSKQRPCSKPSANRAPNPLCPLRGLRSYAPRQTVRGEYNPFRFSPSPLRGTVGVNIIKVSALCGKLPIDIIKGFPRNITKHTKRRKLRHSTNPCGKPSAFSPFPSCPLEGAYTLMHLIKP